VCRFCTRKKLNLKTRIETEGGEMVINDKNIYREREFTIQYDVLFSLPDVRGISVGQDVDSIASKG
jgi:hypothetical protein